MKTPFALLYCFLLIFNSIPSFASIKIETIPYMETEITLDSGSQTIYGTLTIPDIKEEMPLVVFIGSSGPIDRNGNNPFGLATDCYKLLAINLAENKIASLRFDKRGVEKSKHALINEKYLSIGVYVDDAEKWIKLLRKDNRFNKIIVLGHGEGSLIGMMVSNFQRANGFISISGTGIQADSLLIRQISNGSMALGDTAKAIIKKIKNGEPFSINKDLEPIFRPSVVNYLQSWFELNPVLEIAVLRCPVMIIQGTNDLQASVADAFLLGNAKKGARIEIIENMNHVLKTASSDINENLNTYKNPTIPLAADLVPAIVNFVSILK